MAFDELQFPPDISEGAQGGPGFNTTIIVTGSGAEQRIGQWSRGRLKWDVSHALQTPSQMTALVAFFRARMGRLRGFRFKDWSDYTATNQVMQVLTTTTCQLQKQYADTIAPQTRTIKKPVAASLTLNGTAMTFLQLATPTWADLGLVFGPGDTIITSADGRGVYGPPGHAYPEGAYAGDPATPTYDPSAVIVTDGITDNANLACPNLVPWCLALAVAPDGAGPPPLPCYNALRPNRGTTFTPAQIAAVSGGYQGPMRLWGICNDGPLPSGFSDNSGQWRFWAGTQAQTAGTLLNGAGWTVDTTTGIVTADTASVIGGALASFQFDVPVRFDIDDMRYTIDAATYRTWDQIAIVEVLV